jgi:hypothetical protein
MKLLQKHRMTLACEVVMYSCTRDVQLVQLIVFVTRFNRNFCSNHDS